MYTAFYGLREKPFSLTPNPRFLYLTDAHKEALAHLLYGLEEGEGFIVLSGEVGTGNERQPNETQTNEGARRQTRNRNDKSYGTGKYASALAQTFLGSKCKAGAARGIPGARHTTKLPLPRLASKPAQSK